MPTDYTDQFFTIDPFSPPPVGTPINFTRMTLTDQNDDGDIDRSDGDSINGLDVIRSYPGDTVTINVPGVGDITYTGTTFYLSGGIEVFTPTDGQVLQNGTFVSSSWTPTQGPLVVPDDLGPTCFTKGTRIQTKDGPKPIESLKVGDLVQTLDHGLQQVRWIGQSTVAASGKFAPILFKPTSIGNDQPLRVSPQHRMLIQGWQAELFFGQSEVLVPAKHLVDDVSVVTDPCETVTYFHILFDRHEIITAEGVLSESFFPGDQVLMAESDLRRELFELFPELDNMAGEAAGRTARPTVKRLDAVVLDSAA